MRIRSRRSSRPRAATLVATLLLAGCYRWIPVAASPLETVRTAPPAQLRIHRTDGSTVTLRAPRLVTDSTRAQGTVGALAGASDTLVAGQLLGRTLASGESARGGGSRNAIVLVRASEIESAEVRRFSGWRTGAFVALVVGGIAGSLVAFAN